MLVVASEVEDGAADDHIHARVGNRHGFDGLDLEAGCRCGGGQRCGEAAGGEHRVRICVNREHLDSHPQQVHEIAAVSASGIEHPHSRTDAPSQQLVEEVDVDVAELLVERHATRMLQHVSAPSALASSLACTRVTRMPCSSRRSQVRTNDAAAMTCPPTLMTLAAPGSEGSTSICRHAWKGSRETHLGLIRTVRSSMAVTADFRCRQPEVETASTA